MEVAVSAQTSEWIYYPTLSATKKMYEQNLLWKTKNFFQDKPIKTQHIAEECSVHDQ
jgi:hypothetical protein